MCVWLCSHSAQCMSASTSAHVCTYKAARMMHATSPNAAATCARCPCTRPVPREHRSAQNLVNTLHHRLTCVSAPSFHLPVLIRKQMETHVQTHKTKTRWSILHQRRFCTSGPLALVDTPEPVLHTLCPRLLEVCW